MRRTLYLLFLLASGYSYSQTRLQGYIKDAKTKEAVPFCAVRLKNTTTGCLSNEEGLFQLTARTRTDTLLITYIGYKTKQVAVSEFVKDPILYLEVRETSLSEVVIYAGNDYLYTLFENCRNNLLRSKQKESKAYFVLETELAGQPVELMECYYNSTWNNNLVKNLVFKNGRAGIASYNDRFFISQNISKAFTFLNLAEPGIHLPDIPLQYTKRKLKKRFNLTCIEVYDKENPVYHIAFKPADTTRGFSGEAWIEKNSGNLKKIVLEIYNTTEHPFLPAMKDFGEIKNASMQLTKTYAPYKGENLLSHIDFNYQLRYRHIHSSSFLNENRDTVFDVGSKGLMHFYDYEKPFIPPYFDYDPELSDYRKISFLSYNESFWTSNNGLVYSEKMKKGINYFKANGELINYRARSLNKVNSRQKNTWGYETNYIEWSAMKRISLKKSNLKNDTLSNSQDFLANRYRLKAQLFLDLNALPDSIQHYSVAVFDVYQTFYNIPEEPPTNCFINIYFDLFEIERRRMEQNIVKHKFTSQQFDSLYQQSVKQLDGQTSRYLSEAERGKNLKALKKWNELVKDNLGIDNMQLFNVIGNQ